MFDYSAGMSTDVPADGRAAGSQDGNFRVGDFLPLPGESVDPASGLQRIEDELSGMSDDVLEKATIELRASINAAHARFAVQVAELERRDIPATYHGLTMAAWLRHHCRMDSSEASGTAKTARGLVHMPTVVGEAVDGTIPYRSMQLLAQARDRNPEAFPHHESVFAEVATYLTPRGLRKGISHWEQQVNYQQALKDVHHVDRLRSLYLAQTYQGIGEIRGTLNPELFHTITTAINAHTDPTFLDASDRRTPTQRRADALGDICRYFLDHGNRASSVACENRDVADSVSCDSRHDTIRTSGGEKPHITVTIDHDLLTGGREGLAELGDAPVDVETIRKLACDASIVRMVLDADSLPIDVGRKTRTIPPALRRALEHRDGGCVWRGCTAPVSWCDAHHLVHWADGGDTNLGNLILLCRTHHTRIHKLHPQDKINHYLRDTGARNPDSLAPDT
jgi:Domain of unknown function (DUF222)/HNH endonuclease